MHNPAITEKACGRCKQIFPIEEYYVTKTGPSSYCKACHQAKSKQSYERNKDKRLAKNRADYARDPQAHLIRNRAYKFGTTVEEIERLLAENPTCPGCGRPADAIDHDHTTNAIRGVLCKNCNVALGMVKDDPAALRRLADYLDGFNA